MAAVHEDETNSIINIQQCLQREANDQASILPTPEELDLMLTNTDDGTRNFVIDPIALIVDYAANILARFGGNIDRLIDAADDEEEEEVSSIYRQPSWRFYTNLGPSGN